MDRRSLLLGASGLAAGLAAPAIVQAQGAYPSRPVRLVIPWPPGQATDLMARVTASKITESWGQPFVPENRAGAAGMIGTDLVAKAAPDGYTVLAASTGPFTTAPLVQRTPYDVNKDFAPVGQIGISPYVLIVRKDFPAQNAAEFVAKVRAEPGKYTYATSGTGAAAHLITLMFLSKAKLDAVHVPFQGSGPGLTALTAGQVDYAIETPAAAWRLVRDGQLRALGITTAKASALVPGIPPIAEVTDLKDYDLGGWNGLMVPAGTPRPIVDRLYQEVRTGLALPEIRDRFGSIGMEVGVLGPDEFLAHMRGLWNLFRPLIAQLGIKAE